MRFQDVNLNNSELFLSNSSNTNNVSIGVNKIANVQMKSNRDFREDSEYVIELEDDFVPGSEYVLRLFFNGNYSLHFNGIFRRFYKDSFGQNRYKIKIFNYVNIYYVNYYALDHLFHQIFIPHTLGKRFLVLIFRNLSLLFN